MTMIMAIESSCDETACAIVKDGSEILSNIVSSQINLVELSRKWHPAFMWKTFLL